jgi:hypothetical protein
VKKYRGDIFSSNGIILFHESFFDNPVNKSEKNVQVIKSDLIEYSDRVNLRVVFFGGSISSRNIERFRATIPVNVCYENLENFLSLYRLNPKDVDLKQLVYGANSIREELILLKLELWGILYDKPDDSEVSIDSNLHIFKLVKSIFSLIGMEVPKGKITAGYLKYLISKGK